MKLTQKLSLAFLFASLVAVGLAAIFVWSSTAIQFNDYLINQRQKSFVDTVSRYYQLNGNWSGVQTALRAEGLLPPIPQPGDPQPDPQPFALVDKNGVVIIPGGTYEPGQKIQNSVLSRGIRIVDNGLVVGMVLTSGSETPRRSEIDNKYLSSVNNSLLVAALSGAILAFLLGLFIARNLTQPLRDLISATHAMAQGKLDQRVPVRSGDELGELAQAFNKMSSDVHSANQARRQMTADIAHDLRNPLTVIGGYLEGLRDGILQPTQERFDTMQAEVQHLEHLVNDLRTLSLADAGELTINRAAIHPYELLERLALAYQHQAGQLNIEMKVDYEPDLPEICVDSERMEQVLGNLVSNALRYTPDGGQICVSAGKAWGGIVLKVRDNGAGIAPEILPHIFERSYRGDPSRQGNESGLGLSIARSIVDLHGGNLSAQSAGLGKGAEFFIFLPARSAPE